MYAKQPLSVIVGNFHTFTYSCYDGLRYTPVLYYSTTIKVKSNASFAFFVNRQLNHIFVPKISTWQVTSLLNDSSLISLSHKILEGGFVEDGSKVIARKLLLKDGADLE